MTYLFNLKGVYMKIKEFTHFSDVIVYYLNHCDLDLPDNYHTAHFDNVKQAIKWININEPFIYVIRIVHLKQSEVIL